MDYSRSCKAYIMSRWPWLQPTACLIRWPLLLQLIAQRQVHGVGVFRHMLRWMFLANSCPSLQATGSNTNVVQWRAETGGCSGPAFKIAVNSLIWWLPHTVASLGRADRSRWHHHRGKKERGGGRHTKEKNIALKDGSLFKNNNFKSLKMRYNNACTVSGVTQTI